MVMVLMLCRLSCGVVWCVCVCVRMCAKCSFDRKHWQCIYLLLVTNVRYDFIAMSSVKLIEKIGQLLEWHVLCVTVLCGFSITTLKWMVALTHLWNWFWFLQLWRHMNWADVHCTHRKCRKCRTRPLNICTISVMSIRMRRDTHYTGT